MPSSTPEGRPVEVAASPAAGADGATVAARQRPPHAEPEQIGPYRILEKIAEGGMGVVYKAEQKHPVRRLVALKVIKLGMDTREVIARFEAERQALALMSHPSVAKVYEAGATEQGRPYFAMEFVAGIPLVRYCDECRLTTRERLALFIQVCQAVQHAHQKGIIHRDLKPSNILVTHFDGNPVPKVIDFGIAKAANQALTDRTLYTRTGSLIGTPEYMSPEQALTSGLDVDTRTDIYSLGVVLYELLTGTLPLDPGTLQQASPERMAQIIKTAEPPKPSTRLSMLDCGGGAAPAGNGHSSNPTSLAEVASLRRCDPRSLRRELRGDLDWIVLKAMEKDRTRRYETANGLANDVRRHLDDEPISARPPTPGYRMAKFISKHRIGVSAAAAVAVAFGLGLALAIYGLLLARHERDVARLAEENEAAHRRDAERATAESNETSRIMGGLFTGDAPRQFELAVRRLDGGWLADQPEAQAALRITLGTAGGGDMAHIDPVETKRQLTAALALAPRLAEPRRGEVAGAAHYLLGVINQAESHFDVAEQEYLQARAVYRSFHTGTWYSIDTKAQLAAIRRRNGDRAGARAFTFEGIQEDVRYNQARVDASHEWSAHHDQGIALARLGQFPAALLQWDRAIELAPAEHMPRYLRGCLLAYLGEDERYRENSRAMAERFAEDPKFNTVERTLKACVLRADSGVAPDKLKAMADRAMRLATRQTETWANLAKGMACYRSGDFAGCLQAMERAKVVGVHRARDAAADLFTAMAHYQFGQRDLALSAFAAVDRSIQENFQRPGESDLADDGAMSVEDWLIAQTIRREARQLLKPPATTAPAR